MDLLAGGGVALNLWDYRYGPRMNDLVISTKLLDYAAAGIPIVLTTTTTQVELLGEDYPLFANQVDDGLRLIGQVLRDPELYRVTGERAYLASRGYTYAAIHRLISSALDASHAVPRQGG